MGYNYSNTKRALIQTEWEKAMKDMGVSQTMVNEEVGARNQLQHEMEGFN